MAKEAIIELRYRHCGGCINYYYGQCILEPTWVPVPPEHLCGRGVWIEWSADAGQFATFYHGEPKTLIPPDTREEVTRDMEFQPQAPVPHPVPVEAPESVVEAEIEQIREDVARSMEAQEKAKEKAVAQAPRAARIMAPPMSLQEMMDYLKKNPPPPRA